MSLLCITIITQERFQDKIKSPPNFSRYNKHIKKSPKNSKTVLKEKELVSFFIFIKSMIAKLIKNVKLNLHAKLL